MSRIRNERRTCPEKEMIIMDPIIHFPFPSKGPLDLFRATYNCCFLLPAAQTDHMWVHPTATGFPVLPGVATNPQIPYLCADFFPTKEPDCQSQQPHHCPLHQEAEFHCIDTEVIEVVSDSLPDTGHTVPSHNKEEGKGRMKGDETRRIQLPLPKLQTTWYFSISMKNSSWEIQEQTHRNNKAITFLIYFITCKAIRWENSPSRV